MEGEVKAGVKKVYLIQIEALLFALFVFLLNK